MSSEAAIIGRAFLWFIPRVVQVLVNSSSYKNKECKRSLEITCCFKSEQLVKCEVLEFYPVTVINNVQKNTCHNSNALMQIRVTRMG
jgi:hypothetical protein